MDKLEPLKINRYIKTGIFKSREGKNALAFAYDLRPDGSVWTLPDNLDGIEALDLFGNPVDFSSGHSFWKQLNPFDASSSGRIALTYEPCYLRGPYEKVLAAMKSSKFDSFLGNRFELKAFPVGRYVYLRAESLAGVEGVLKAEIAAGGETIPLNFNFAEGKDNAILRLEATPFEEAIKSGGCISWRGDFNGHRLETRTLTLPAFSSTRAMPAAESSAFKAELRSGDKAWLWADKKFLRIKVEIRDDDIIAAKDSNLWNGDALEVFIDNDPVTRSDKHLAASMASVRQYVFAATPSLNGVEVLCAKGKTAATLYRSKTANGYSLLASIPLDEIKPSNDRLLGVDFEIDKISKTGFAKESLGGKPGTCHKSRREYPLWELDASSINNGSAIVPPSQLRAIPVIGAAQVAGFDRTLQNL